MKINLKEIKMRTISEIITQVDVRIKKLVRPPLFFSFLVAI